MGRRAEIFQMKHVMGILLGLLVAASLAFQLWQLHRFINAGPRFTAADGQALCERVAALEPHPGPCNYEGTGK